LDSECGKISCKPVTTSRILTFRSYMVVMSDLIWEMPLSFINSFALMFLENLCPDICVAVNMMSSYLVEPHWIGAKNLLRHLQGTISHELRYTVGNMKPQDYSVGRQCGRSLEHFSVLFLFGICLDILDEQEAEVGDSEHHQGRIHCC